MIVFAGRLVFGFGAESLIVANSALLADWFRGKELAFAFGINLSIARLGSVTTNLVSPLLAESSGVVFASWFAVVLCAMSVMCVVITMPIDRYFDKMSLLQHSLLSTEDVEDNKGLLVKTVDGRDHLLVGGEEQQPQAPVNTTQFKDIFSFSKTFWILAISCVAIYGCVNPFNNVSASLLLERDYFIANPSSCTLTIPTQCQSDENGPITGCPTSQWYQPPLPMDVDTQCGFYPGQLTDSDIDCTQSCWKDGCASVYCDRLSKGEKRVSFIMSIPYIISGVMSPILGFAVDRVGLRAVVILVAPLLIVIVHTLLGYSDVSPVGPLVGQGLAYTGFAAVFWPAVPLVVEEKLTGLAFGVVTSLLNAACAVFPLIVAAVYNTSGDRYIPNVELMFILLGVIGVVVGIYLNYYDYQHGSVLNRGAPAEDDPSPSEAGVTMDQPTRAISVEKRLHSTDRGRINSSTHIEHSERAHRHSRGSFTAHEEVLYGGAFDHLQSNRE